MIKLRRVGCEIEWRWIHIKWILFWISFKKEGGYVERSHFQFVGDKCGMERSPTGYRTVRGQMLADAKYRRGRGGLGSRDSPDPLRGRYMYFYDINENRSVHGFNGRHSRHGFIPCRPHGLLVVLYHCSNGPSDSDIAQPSRNLHQHCRDAEQRRLPDAGRHSATVRGATHRRQVPASP